MEPVGTGEQPAPVEIAGIGQREATALAIIDDLGSALRRARRQEIEAHPPRPGGDA
jgi:hypothetical protein